MGPSRGADLNVSRETQARLEVFVELLSKWQKSINLVSKTTLPEAWTRHILDSAQLAALIPSGARVLDCGSGAGLPGLVLAAIQPIELHSVESDARKVAFQRQAAQAMSLEALPGRKVVWHNSRLETLSPISAQIICARAFAPLPKLLRLGYKQNTDDIIWLLAKGRQAQAEIEDARQEWDFEAEIIPSQTDPQGCILRLTQVQMKSGAPA